jgi:hypothetical protein
MPDPAELREIAKRYVREVRKRIECFDDILGAEPAPAEPPPDDHNPVRAIVANALAGGALKLIEPVED